MALTQEDLQAIRALMREENEPIRQDVRELNQRVAVVESKVLHELGIIKDGITGWQERNRQIDRLEDTVDNHDHRIWALEQKSKAV